jgi:hypothetical protein
MSPAGTSVYSPMWRYSSVMNDWQNRITSASLSGPWGRSRPALAAADRQPVSAFLNDLLEAQELDDAQVDTDGWKRSPPLNGTQRGVELDPEAPVDVDVALVIGPRHAEHHLAFRLHQPLQDGPFGILRVLVD